MPLDEKLQELLCCIFKTHEEEIDSKTWDLYMERVAEMAVNGEDIATVLPAIQHYLDNAPDCREEFLALVAMLKAESAEEKNF